MVLYGILWKFDYNFFFFSVMEQLLALALVSPEIVQHWWLLNILKEGGNLWKFLLFPVAV